MKSYKPLTLIAGVALLAMRSASLLAQTTLDSGHVDIGLAYEDNQWNLHVHQHDTDTEFAPGEAILRLNPSSARPVPSAPSFSFLGASDATYFVLPQVQEAGLLYLGLAAEEIPDGEFQGNSLRMSLRTLSGPGNFSLYAVDGFGNPTVHMNTADGISAGDDFFNVQAGSHADLNWAFSSPGSYTIGFEASGIHAANGPVASGLVQYHFEVVPEPGTWALLGLGGIFLIGLGKRR